MNVLLWLPELLNYNDKQATTISIVTIIIMYGTPSRHNNNNINPYHASSTPLSAASRTSLSRRGGTTDAAIKGTHVPPPPVVADFFAVIEDTPVEEWQKRSAALRKVVDSIPEFPQVSSNINNIRVSASNTSASAPDDPQSHQQPQQQQPHQPSDQWYTSSAALRHLAIPIAELLKDPRSTVVKRTCESLARLFHKCQGQARYLVRDLMPTILSVHAQTVQVIRQAVQAMVSDAAIPNVPCKMVMPLWMERLKVDKSRTVRDACALYLGQALQHWDTPDGYLTAEIWLQVGNTLIRTLRDPSPQVRSHAKLALEHMQERHADYWERLLHDPDGPASKDRKVYRWLLSLGTNHHTPDGPAGGTIGGVDAEELSVASKFSYNSDSRYAARTVPSTVLGRSTTPSKRATAGTGTGSHHARSASLGGGATGAPAAFTPQEEEDLFGITPPSSSVPLSISYHPPPPPLPPPTTTSTTTTLSSTKTMATTTTSSFLKRRMAGRSSSNPRAAREETTTTTTTTTAAVKPNLRITVPTITTTTDAVALDSSSGNALPPFVAISAPFSSPESPPPKPMSGAGPPPALATPERVETSQNSNSTGGGGGGTSPSTPKYLNTIHDQEEEEGNDDDEDHDGDINGIPDELESNPSFPTDLNHAFGKTGANGSSRQTTPTKLPNAVAAAAKTTPVEASSVTTTLSNEPEDTPKEPLPSKFHFHHANDETIIANGKQQQQPPAVSSWTEPPTEHEPKRITTTEDDGVHFVAPTLSASRSEDTTTEKNGGDGGGPFIQSMQQLKQHASKRRSRNSILMQERFRMSGSLLDDAGGSEDNYDQSESAAGDVMMKYSEEENEVPKGEDKNNTTNAKLSSPRHLQDNNTNIYQHLPSQQQQQQVHSYHSTAEATKSPTLTASSSAPEHMIIAIRLLRAHKAHVDQIMETLKIEMDTLRDFDRLLEEPGRPVEEEVLDYFEGVGLCLDQRTQAGEALQREMDRISRGEPPQES